MKQLLNSLLVLISITVAPQARAEELQKLTPQQVSAKLKERGFYVFDNNEKGRWIRGHVPGATWVSPTEVDAKLLPADKNAVLVFYCANEHCGACHEGAKRALKLGYKNVYIMPAGIAGWEKAGLPTERGS